MDGSEISLNNPSIMGMCIAPETKHWKERVWLFVSRHKMESLWIWGLSISKLCSERSVATVPFLSIWASRDPGGALMSPVPWKYVYFFTVMRLGANFHTSSRSSIMQTMESPHGKRFLLGQLNLRNLIWNYGFWNSINSKFWLLMNTWDLHLWKFWGYRMTFLDPVKLKSFRIFNNLLAPCEIFHTTKMSGQMSGHHTRKWIIPTNRFDSFIMFHRMQFQFSPKIPSLWEWVDTFISRKDPMREKLLFGIQKT